MVHEKFHVKEEVPKVSGVEKKEEIDSEKVKLNSICGASLETFDQRVSVKIEKTKETFNGKPLFKAVKPEYKDKEVRVFLLPTEGKGFTEVQAKDVDSRK
jgi:hypothetical protein